MAVNRFDRLFQAHGDKQANDDRGDMDEEVWPTVRGLVRWMDVEHGPPAPSAGKARNTRRLFNGWLMLPHAHC